jgi:hypothetical protein
MKKIIKKYIRTFSPALFWFISGLLQTRRNSTLFKAAQDMYCKKIYGDDQIAVLQGPFEGMHYYNLIVWGPLMPKWIGSYEMELHEIVETAIKNNYNIIINIGAAEGYYSVGLAYMCPDSKVFAFDINPVSRSRQKQLAEINGVTNLTVRGYCECNDLDQLIDDNTLLIVDIEGDEVHLLDINQVNQFNKCDILVECHPSGVMGMQDVVEHLTGSFSKTHDVNLIRVQSRQASDIFEKIPSLNDSLTSEELEFALMEGRDPAQVWLWMTAGNSE